MDFRITMPEAEADITQCAEIYYTVWQECYRGIVDNTYLSKMNINVCISAAKRWRSGLLAAKHFNKAIGFISYGAYHEELKHTGEIYALYVLRQYRGMGVGRELTEAAITALCKYKKIALWVAKSNFSAIRFYENMGFIFHGTERTLRLGTPIKLRLYEKVTFPGRDPTSPLL